MQKVYQRMVARFDAVRLFIFVLILWTLQPHFTLWLSAVAKKKQKKTLHCFFRAYACHNTGLDQAWTQCPTLDVVLYQVLRVSEQQC